VSDNNPKTMARKKSFLMQQAVKRNGEKAEPRGVLSRQRDQQVQRADQHGSKAVETSQSSGAGHSLLQLQQRYGNRYVQRMLARQGEDETDVSPDVEQGIQRARGGGQALDGGARAQMEPAFGADFSGVRVHTDAESDTLSRSLNARAFTTGRDIFFRRGTYNPGNSSGRELIAHELTHVAQQSGGQVQPKLTVSQPGDRFEREADQVAQAVMQREQRAAQAGGDAGIVSRQTEEEEPVQAKLERAQVQRQAEEEEPVQAKSEELLLQRQTPEEEETPS